VADFRSVPLLLGATPGLLRVLLHQVTAEHLPSWTRLHTPPEYGYLRVPHAAGAIGKPHLAKLPFSGQGCRAQRTHLSSQGRSRGPQEVAGLCSDTEAPSPQPQGLSYSPSGMEISLSPSNGLACPD